MNNYMSVLFRIIVKKYGQLYDWENNLCRILILDYYGSCFNINNKS